MTQFWYKLVVTVRLALIGWECVCELGRLEPGDTIEFTVDLDIR